MDKDTPRAHHDLGGATKFMCEAVDTTPHGLTEFDKQVDASRGIEAIPEAEYHRLSYYRRWIRSITTILLQKGVITEAELRAALEAR
jgi:hypothetical protein